MKKIASGLMVFVACVSSIVAQPRLVEKAYKPDDSFAPADYILSWADEFNEFTLDTSEWFYRDGIDRNRTIMAHENIILDHGEMHIVCQAGKFRAHPDIYDLKTGQDTFNFKGGGIISEWRFREGYFEARCKMLHAPYWHPAFWLERANSNPDNSLIRWTQYSEIDIMETEPNHATWQSIRVHDAVTGDERRKLPVKVKENDWGRTYCTDQHGAWFVWGMKLTQEKAMFYENESLVATVDIPEDYVRDARNIVLSCLTIKDPVESGIQKFDWVRFYEPITMRENSRKECENLILHTSAFGEDIFDNREKNASGNYYQNIVNARDGDFIRYRIYVTEPGSYNIKLGFLQQAENKGSWQLHINGEEQGDAFRQDGKEKFKEADLGIKRFWEAGYHEFRFVCDAPEGETGSGTFDYIELIRQYSDQTAGSSEPGEEQNQDPFPYTVTADTKNRELSAAMKRSFYHYEAIHSADNELFSQFKYTKPEGFDYNDFDGTISRRDPSKVIFENGKYYVWYTYRHTSVPPVGASRANESTETIPSTDWDLAEIWYATSEDGFTWEEQGAAITRPAKPNVGWRSVTTADILKWKGKYYLYYQAFMEASGKRGDYCPVAVSWADSPDGPWTPTNEIVIPNGPEGAWDQYAIHDPYPLIHDGKIYLYYKSAFNRPGNVWVAGGLAISDNPFGPFEKHPLNPVLNSGHEVSLFPFKEGVAALINKDGQEHNTIQYASDWVNFEIASITELLPYAAAPYVPDAFTDTKEGQGITWGMAHFINQGGKGKTHSQLVRFDCDLSLDVDDHKMKELRVIHQTDVYYRQGLDNRQRERIARENEKMRNIE